MNAVDLLVSLSQYPVGLFFLDVLPDPPTPSGDPQPVYPQGGQGFAAYIVGGFFGLGILILAMILLSRRPRRAQPPRESDLGN